MADRRNKPERRRPAERRRASGAPQVAVEICHSEMRFSIVRHSQNGSPHAIFTRVVPWRKEATSYHSDAAARELSNALQTVVVEEKITGAKLRVALSGELCVTRILSGSEDYVRQELAQLEDRSQLYLSLGPGKKAITGDIQQLDARHQHALLAVSSQRTLDMLVQIAGESGVQVESIEPSLVAIGRVVAIQESSTDEPTIVIHLDEESVDLGIYYNGRLLLDYRPSGTNKTEDAAKTVMQHLPRLQRYCNRHYSFLEKPLKKVLVCGNAKLVERAVASFNRSDILEAKALNPSFALADWQFAEDSPGSNMAAVLGTLLSYVQTDDDQSSPNLMEHLISQTRAPMRPILVRSLLPIAAALLVAAFFYSVNFWKQKEIHTLQGKLDALAATQAQTTELRLRYMKETTELQHLKVIETKLQPRAWAEVVSLIGRCMPNDVWLDRMTIQNGQNVALAGASFADGGIYEYVRWLEKAPGLQEVVLDGTRAGQTATGPSTNFDIELTLANLDDHDNQE